MSFETKLDLPKTDEFKVPAYDGHTVYRWPEFLAFAKRLGIPLERLIKNLTITINCEEAVRVYLEMLGSDVGAARVNTTTMNNELYETSRMVASPSEVRDA